MVRYRCKRHQATRNVELVRNLFDELHQTQPRGIGYAVFGLEDGVSFIQLVVTETEDKLAPLASLESYQKLQEDKADRFEDGPFITELRELGSYRILAE